MKKLLLQLCIASVTTYAFAQTNYINATGYIGIGNASPTNYLQIGSGTGSLHTGGPNGILFKAGRSDRSLFELNMILLQKVGELPLHLIEKNKQLSYQQTQLDQLQKQLSEINSKLK